MALIDRLAHDDGVTSIPNHQFSAAIYLWSKGEITRQNVIDSFELDTTDEVQLDQLSTYYTGLSAEGKQEFHSRLEATGALLETGRITKAQYRTFLELT